MNLRFLLSKLYHKIVVNGDDILFNLNSELFFSMTKMVVFAKTSSDVIPAKAGIHRFLWIPDNFLRKFPE